MKPIGFLDFLKKWPRKDWFIYLLTWTIFKVFIEFVEFVTTLFLFFMLWFFAHEAYGILAPRPGIEPSLPTLEGEVLTTRPPGKAPVAIL